MILNVEPVDSCLSNVAVTVPTLIGRSPCVVSPMAVTGEEGVGVGGSVGGFTVTRFGCVEVSPEAATAVRITSPVATTVMFVEPLAGRSPAAPAMFTWSAPVVIHVARAVRGEQPESGVIVKELITGAVEKALRTTESGMPAPSLVRLSFLIAYGIAEPEDTRARMLSFVFSAAAGTRVARACCAAAPGAAKSAAEPTSVPPSKAAHSTLQPPAPSGLHRTPTFVRARPGSVDEEASAPPPQASSPAVRKSETGKAVNDTA